MKKYELIKMEIPEETSKKMQSSKWTNNAVWKIADVITWMQSDIDKWLKSKDNNKK